MRTPLPGRFFYEVPEHQPLLKKWMTGLGDEDTFVLLLKKYHQHREAHRPDTVWMALRYAWRPQERNPWQYGAELLEWGMHQPWASSIDIRAVVNAFNARHTHDERPKAWRTLPTRIPKLFQQAVARAVAENIQNPASWLLSDGSKLESLQEWAWLYHTAYQSNLSKETEMQWRTMCVQTLQRHTDDQSDTAPQKIEALRQQGQWLRNQLATEMLNNPAPIWEIAIRYIHPRVWIQEINTIRALYGTNEMQLAYKLPYMAYPTMETGDLHQQLVETFCPTAYPVLQGLLDPNDWADSTKITDMIAWMEPGMLTSPPQSVSLPIL